MGSDYLLWLLTALYAAHILEEYQLGWRSWAQKTIGIPVTWTDFYLTNAAVIVLSVCLASIGWRVPAISLIYPGLMLINAIFFHIIPTIWMRQISPGVFTAVVLFLPGVLATYIGAANDGVLNVGTLVVSLIGGALAMALPLVLFPLKRRFGAG